MIQLFAKKSCSACIRIPCSFDLRLAKTARTLSNIAAANFPALCNGGVRVIALDGADFLFQDGSPTRCPSSGQGCAAPRPWHVGSFLTH